MAIRRLYFDEVVDGSLHGWTVSGEEASVTSQGGETIGGDSLGWTDDGGESRSDASDDATGAVELSLSGLVVSRHHRGFPRPDIDKVVGRSNAAKGFVIPVRAVSAFSALMGKSATFEPSIRYAAERYNLSALPQRYSDFSTFRSVRLCDGGGPFRIVDMWFATEAELKIRIDGFVRTDTDAAGYTVRFFQFALSQSQSLLLVHEEVVRPEGAAILSPNLKNPLLPVLLTVSAGDGETVAVDLIPFPSFCRGGIHHPELFAVGLTSDYLFDLRSVSDALVREFVGWADAPAARSIGEVSIDLVGANGAEKIFSPHLLEWLTCVMQVKIAIQQAPSADECPTLDGTMIDVIQKRIAEYQERLLGGEGGDLILRLPSDAVPTISGLASRRLGLFSGEDSDPCAYISMRATGKAPAWLVNIPPISGWLSELQPRTARVAYPILMGRPDAASKSPDRDQLGLPMAIRFVDISFVQEEDQVFPVASDMAGSILGKAMRRGKKEEIAVSVIVSVRDDLNQLTHFLESVASQSIADAVELVIVNNRSLPWLSSEIQAVAGHTFRDRLQLVDYDAETNRSAQSNLAARHTRGTFLAFSDLDVVLHDSRILETLCAMADHDNVASASCMLLSKKGKRKSGLSVHSAGYFPSEMSLLGRPCVVYDQPNTEGLPSMTTYPVVANSFSLAVVRSDIWAQLGGMNQAVFPESYRDVDYGIRALKKGLVSLCTTAISAIHAGESWRGQFLDVYAKHYLSSIPVEAILANCTILRRLG